MCGFYLGPDLDELENKNNSHHIQIQRAKKKKKTGNVDIDWLYLKFLSFRNV